MTGAPRPLNGAVVDSSPAAPLPHACEPVPSADVSGTPPTTGPGTPGRGSGARLIGIDAARGLALLGMMSVHTLSAYDADGQLSLAWSLSAGKAAALFAVLAGVGVAFASGGRLRPRARSWQAHASSLLVRALLIGAVGLLIGFVVPDDYAAVILPYYALLFVLAIPLLALSVRALVCLAAGIAVAVPVLSHVLRSGRDLASVPNLTFADVLGDPVQVLGYLALTGAYPALPWMAYLCAGLAVGRALLSSRATVVGITLAGIGLAVLARLTAWLLLDVFGGGDRLESATTMTAADLDRVLASGWGGVTPSDTAWWLATAVPHSSTPLDLMFTIGVSLTVIGGCILLGRATTGLLRPLATAGSMTLTLYCLHLLLLSWPAMPGGSSGLVVQVVILVLFALLWNQHHARGPMEEVVARASSAVRRRVESAGSAAGPAGTTRDDDAGRA